MENTSEANENATPIKIIGFFDDRESLEKAYHEIIALDYPPVSITMAMAEEKYYQALNHQTEPQASTNADLQQPKYDAQGGPETGLDTYHEQKSTKSQEGIALGTAAGAGIGAVALLGASVMLPVAGIAFLGPLVATLAGAGSGATVGGLFGLLFGAGHPETEIRDYEQNLKNGKYMISSSPRSQEDGVTIEQKWKSLGGRVNIIP